MRLKTIVLEYIEYFLINELNFKSVTNPLNFYDLTCTNNKYTILVLLNKSEEILIEIIQNDNFLDSKFLPISFNLLEEIKDYILKSIS